MFVEHYLVGVTNRDESESLEPQVFVMDMNTGRANTFAKVNQISLGICLAMFAIPGSRERARSRPQRQRRYLRLPDQSQPDRQVQRPSSRGLTGPSFL
jgi:hypothetical protein